MPLRVRHQQAAMQLNEARQSPADREKLVGLLGGEFELRAIGHAEQARHQFSL